MRTLLEIEEEYKKETLEKRERVILDLIEELRKDYLLYFDWCKMVHKLKHNCNEYDIHINLQGFEHSLFANYGYGDECGLYKIIDILIEDNECMRDHHLNAIEENEERLKKLIKNLYKFPKGENNDDT